ncbi:MAG: cation transporter [Acidimicrobiia bacterium]|nr:cation transporter [Acidimicrobiia bacterium]
MLGTEPDHQHHGPHDADHGHSHSGPDHAHDADHGHSHGGADHGHGHGSHQSWWSAIEHGLGGLFGTHSHDPAESLDSALESSERGTRALVISFSVLMATAIVQALIVVFTGSVSLIADTIHNFSDALTAVPLFIAFRLGRRAATRRYTYGYRRAEDLAGLFVVLMILISAIVVIWESINRLSNPQELHYLGVLFAAGVVGFAGNELVALYRIRVGRQIGSAALVADGRHARADGFTSLAVAVAAVGVWLGFDRADPIAGIVVGIVILRIMWSACRDIYGRLMDAVDPELVDEIEGVANSVEGVLSVNACQVRWMGHRLRADISIGVALTLTVEDGHHIGEHVREALRQRVRFLDEAFVHVHADSTDRASA